jgi:hypothetical protein
MRWIAIASLALLSGVILKATTPYHYIEYWLVPVCMAVGVLLLVRREQAKNRGARHLAPRPTVWTQISTRRAKHL